MNGLWQHLRLSLRLYFRNRMAMLYGYLFPTVFLLAFWVLYRHERVPLIGHMGEVLTITILGGACFGLATTLVSERERSVWRRFKLAPIPTAGLLASTLLARYILLLTAGLLQIALAMGLGMPLPAHPLELLVAFTLASFAFLGLGLVIAMLADNVPAVQALAQCIFLPMLVIGGVAVPLASLPDWALHISVYFPGRHAVEAIQATVNGGGLSQVAFSLLALVAIGVAACVAGAGMFRWDAKQRFTQSAGKGWLAVALAGWVGVGLIAQAQNQVIPPELARARAAAQEAQATFGTGDEEPIQAQEDDPPWAAVTMQQIAADLDFIDLPSDYDVVTPIVPYASMDEADYIHPLDRAELDRLIENLPNWGPAQDPDLLVRIRNLLMVPAAVDLAQFWMEWYMPLVVLEYLRETFEEAQLLRVLYWIALHADEIGDEPLPEFQQTFGFSIAQTPEVMEDLHYRIRVYAIKFIGRITGLRPPQ